jgi:hypothetical protein
LSQTSALAFGRSGFRWLGPLCWCSRMMIESIMAYPLFASCAKRSNKRSPRLVPARVVQMHGSKVTEALGQITPRDACPIQLVPHRRTSDRPRPAQQDFDAVLRRGSSFSNYSPKACVDVRRCMESLSSDRTEGYGRPARYRMRTIDKRHVC